jgi:hypothetical protein
LFVKTRIYFTIQSIHQSRQKTPLKETYGKSRETLNKDLSLSLDSGRIRLCEAPCGADAALFRDSPRQKTPLKETYKKSRETLNKGLSLSLDSGRIRLCEAPCGADAALFRDSQIETPLKNSS